MESSCPTLRLQHLGNAWEATALGVLSCGLGPGREHRGQRITVWRTRMGTVLKGWLPLSSMGVWHSGNVAPGPATTIFKENPET